MRRLVWLILGIFGACGATCSRSEVRSVERQETAILDVHAQAEERAITSVDRHEVHEQGPIHVVEVIEEFSAPVDGGGVPLVRRTTKTTDIAPSSAVLDIDVDTDVKASSTLDLVETEEIEDLVLSDVQTRTDVGLSWPTKFGIVVAALVAGYVFWRTRIRP